MSRGLQADCTCSTLILSQLSTEKRFWLYSRFSYCKSEISKKWPRSLIDFSFWVDDVESSAPGAQQPRSPHSFICTHTLPVYSYSRRMIDGATIPKCDHRITSIHRIVFNYSAECISLCVNRWILQVARLHQVILLQSGFRWGRLQICNNYSLKFYK